LLAFLKCLPLSEFLFCLLHFFPILMCLFIYFGLEIIEPSHSTSLKFFSRCFMDINLFGICW
jgi:hypothetical protein